MLDRIREGYTVWPVWLGLGPIKGVHKTLAQLGVDSAERVVLQVLSSAYKAVHPKGQDIETWKSPQLRPGVEIGPIEIDARWVQGVQRHVAFGVICGHVPASDIVASSAVWKAVSLMRDEDLGMKAHVIGSWSGVTMSEWSMLAPDVWAGLFRTGRRDMIEHAHVRVERGNSVYWVGLGVYWGFRGERQDGRVHLWCGTVHGQVMGWITGGDYLRFGAKPSLFWD